MNLKELGEYFANKLARSEAKKEKKKNKYNAQRTARGFPSQLEEAVYDQLLWLQRGGVIRDLKRQQTVVLQPGPREERITWRIDFSYTDCATGELVYAEAKGHETGEYINKLKMFRANPPTKLEIWKGTAANPKIVEIVRPK